MNDIVAGAIRWTLQLVVVAMGALFFLSLLAAAAVLALVWGARAVWARLTGRPVMPWAMRMNPREGWSTVYRSTARWTAPGPTAHAPQRSTDVTDVVPREVQ